MAVRPGNNWTTDDLDYIGRPREERFDSWGTAEIITEYKEGISVGRTMDGVADLGGLHRQLLQENDFHAVGRKLFKKLSPEEESEKFGFDGSSLPEELKAVFRMLEEEGLNSSLLKSAINLVKEEDPDSINWIAEHWELFLDTNHLDALSKVDGSMTDCEDSEDQFKEEEKVALNVSPARDSYRVVESFQKSFFKEASERRLQQLKYRLRDASDCYLPQDVEVQLDSIRPIYQEDKYLTDQWSQERKKEDRRLYLETLHKRRENGENLDFESIRRKVWFCFDKEQEEKISRKSTNPVKKEWVQHFNPKTGKVSDSGIMSDKECDDIINSGNLDPRTYVEERSTTSSCLWDKEKSKAFCNLNQTKSQWFKVYNLLWEKMEETILWRLHSMKDAREGQVLSHFIRRFQYRLDADKLGETLIKKATKAQTRKGKEVVRTLLSSCQYRLHRDVIQEIVRSLHNKRI